MLIAHDIRSCHNVGSLLRTADGLGVEKVYLTGYTPYPAGKKDERLPHLAAKQTKQIHKTALGAEHSVAWQHETDVQGVLDTLRAAGYTVVALEQSPKATLLPDYNPPQKIALLLGSEVSGVADMLLQEADAVVEIPMRGLKESFNVVQATAIALYALSNA